MSTWFRYATTDAQVIGLLTWVGLFVTIAGFWVAIGQIRKVKRASAAANEAVSDLVHIVRTQEQKARIVSGLDHFSAAQAMMKHANREATAVHLLVGWTALIAAREYTDDDADRETITRYVISSRRLLDEINAPAVAWPCDSDIANKRHYALSDILSELGTMSARLNARLPSVGKNR